MSHLLELMYGLDILEAFLFFGIVNLWIFAISVGFCWWLGQRLPDRRLFDRWQPFSTIEGLAALGSILLNTGISVIGWYLWTQGWIDLNLSTQNLSAQGLGLGAGSKILFDTLLMVLAMDLGMYGLHRIAHHPWLYPILHAFHHRHETTNPISLFVLHPFEVLGFGGQMIAFLIVYPMDPSALMAYLTLNVVFGTLGHSGVEPFPRFLARIPLLRWVGTSTFHAGHHEHPIHNFGFYTLIWDQLFGTLDPQYWNRYQAAVAPSKGK